LDLLITHKQFNKDGTKDKSIGNRLGIIRDGTQTGMVEMIMVINLPRITKRKYIHARLSKASVSKVIIERTLKLVTVTITTRPGIIIGKGGQEVDKLKNLRRLLKRGSN
jgi:small subunit ribosomal protein S3